MELHSKPFRTPGGFDWAHGGPHRPIDGGHPTVLTAKAPQLVLPAPAVKDYALASRFRFCDLRTILDMAGACSDTQRVGFEVTPLIFSCYFFPVFAFRLHNCCTCILTPLGFVGFPLTRLEGLHSGSFHCFLGLCRCDILSDSVDIGNFMFICSSDVFWVSVMQKSFRSVDSELAYSLILRFLQLP